jgi:nucleotide-binding universal stress UspA family protein
VPQPVLLCFDGSDDARAAIKAAVELLGTREAVVVTAWEPVSVWAPYDPGAVLSAGVAKLSSNALGLDEIAQQVAEENTQRGVELARQAGFEARGQTVRGKTWHAICDAADELDAAPIVLGARGLSRIGAMVLGSVSAAVVAHARRPVLVVPRQDEATD